LRQPSRCSRACPPTDNPVRRAGSYSCKHHQAFLRRGAGVPRWRTRHRVRPRETIVVSKRTRDRAIEPESIDLEFKWALEETEHRQRDRGRRIELKTQQLCRQVQWALNLALAGQFPGGALDDVFVVEATAAAGCGRLLVHVAVPAGQPVSAALQALRDRAPQLRAIVAGYISRKRAPELAFVVAPHGRDAYE